MISHPKSIPKDILLLYFNLLFKPHLLPNRLFSTHCTTSRTIPPVEAAMLQELQKTHKSFRNLEGLVLGLIGDTYRNTSKGKAAN